MAVLPTSGAGADRRPAGLRRRSRPRRWPATVQLWPHRHGTDAMFFALRPQAAAEAEPRRPGRDRQPSAAPAPRLGCVSAPSAEPMIAPSILSADFARLGDEAEAVSRRRLAARRRHGRPLRAEPDPRAAGGAEPAPGHRPAAGLPPDDRRPGPLGAGLRRGRRGATSPSTSRPRADPVQTARDHPRRRGAGRAGGQAGHPARALPRPAARVRHAAGDDRRARLRRPGVHGRGAAQGAAGPRSTSTPATCGCSSRSTAASTRTPSSRPPRPAPTCSSPARPSTAPTTRPRRSTALRAPGRARRCGTAGRSEVGRDDAPARPSRPRCTAPLALAETVRGRTSPNPPVGAVILDADGAPGRRGRHRAARRAARRGHRARRGRRPRARRHRRRHPRAVRAHRPHRPVRRRADRRRRRPGRRTPSPTRTRRPAGGADRLRAAGVDVVRRRRAATRRPRRAARRGCTRCAPAARSSPGSSPPPSTAGSPPPTAPPAGSPSAASRADVHALRATGRRRRRRQRHRARRRPAAHRPRRADGDARRAPAAAGRARPPAPRAARPPGCSTTRAETLVLDTAVPRFALKALFDRGVRHVLLEGGPTLAGAFLEARLRRRGRGPPRPDAARRRARALRRRRESPRSPRRSHWTWTSSRPGSARTCKIVAPARWWPEHAAGGS